MVIENCLGFGFLDLGFLCQPDRAEVSEMVVDGKEGLPPDGSQHARRRRSDDKRSEESRPHGDRDGIEVCRKNVRLRECLGDDGEDAFRLGPRRFFGYDAAGPEECVFGAGDDVAENAGAIFHDRRCRFVA